MRPIHLLVLLFLLVPSCVDVETEMEHANLVVDWRDEIIYQVMVDRFEDGDQNNNYNVDYRDAAAYHGGDWLGLINRLDYIEDLGVTALWISPVVRNVEADAGFGSYHGYWTQDFTRVNPHFGDLSQLQALVRACHERGIKVILDIVTNHVGQLFYYDINRNGQPDTVFFGGGGPGQGSRTESEGNQGSDLRRVSEWDPEYDHRGVQGFTSLGENGPAPIVFVEDAANNRTPPNPEGFRNPEWYNRRGRVTVWENECACFIGCDASCDGLYNPWKNDCAMDCWERHREQEMTGDFPGGLKDLNTRRQDVRDALVKVFKEWIRVADFDGFRIDTLKHQEVDFFDDFAPRIRAYAKALGKDNFFMFGEAFDGRDFLLGEYTHGEGVDSVFYFSAKYQIFDDVFGRGNATDKVRELYDGRRALQRFGDTPSSEPCTAADAACRIRYSDQPKANGPTDAAGNGLNSQQLLVHFMDNHDVPRWLSSFPNQIHRYRNAMAFLLTTDGVPCIYYGAEQDLAGGPDPSNREDMWATGFATDGDTFGHMKKLIALRKRLPALRRGNLTITRSGDSAGILAFERLYQVPGGQPQNVLVVLNTHDEDTRPTDDIDGGVLRTSLGSGIELVDVFEDDTATVGTTDSEGRIDLRIPPNGVRILVPRNQL